MSGVDAFQRLMQAMLGALWLLVVAGIIVVVIIKIPDAMRVCALVMIVVALYGVVLITIISIRTVVDWIKERTRS